MLQCQHGNTRQEIANEGRQTQFDSGETSHEGEHRESTVNFDRCVFLAVLAASWYESPLMKAKLLSLLVGISLTTPAWCAAAANDANLEALQKSAKAYVEAFNKADAEALARTYLPDGEITLADGTVITGREKIQEFYEDEFSEVEKSSAALEARSVRFVTPGVAIENGTLHITAPDGEISSRDYTAVQVKQENGSWLTASVRGEAADQAPPGEKMIGMEWIIGDWVIELNDSETTLSFEWSKAGPYIEGSAVLGQTDGGADSLSIRIGWDNARKGFVSWTFDSNGGFVRSDWTANGNLTWLLRTQGVTAEGEVNQYTQTCEVDPKRQSFKWVVRDHSIGDEVQPDRVLLAVRRPPEPKSATGESKPDASKPKPDASKPKRESGKPGAEASKPEANAPTPK